MGIDTNLNISLPPPGPGGDNEQYTNLVVNTRTNKAVGADDDAPPALNNNLKAIFGDDIDSLAEAQELTDQLNINLQLGGTLKNAKAKMQAELDNLDPSNPRVPILGKYIDICDKLLEGKSIPGVNFALGVDADGSTILELDADNVGVAGATTTAPTTNLSGTVGGNPWLAGNAYVTFLVNYLTLAKLMMENKMVESKAEVAGLMMTMELGRLAADQIIESGKKAAEMHRVAGAIAAATAATTILTTAISLRGMVKNRAKPEPIEDVSYTPLNNKGKPPDLNNEMRPMLGADGKQMKVEVPRYIEVKQPSGDPKIYRNKGKPMFSLKTDKHGYEYLPSGRNPIQPSDQLAAAGIKGVNAPGSGAVWGGRGVGGVEHVKAPAYDQSKIEVKNGVSYKVTDKKDIRADNETRNQNFQKYSMMGNATREFFQSIGKSVEEFLKANLEMEKAQAEYLKEFFSTISRLNNHSLDRASDGVKSQGDMLAQLLQQLDSIRAKLQEAITAALKKSGG